MPKCYICDQTLTNDFKVGPDLKPEPCTDCMESSAECLAEMDEEHKHVTLPSDEGQEGFANSPVPKFFKDRDEP